MKRGPSRLSRGYLLATCKGNLTIRIYPYAPSISRMRRLRRPEWARAQLHWFWHLRENWTRCQIFHSLNFWWPPEIKVGLRSPNTHLVFITPRLLGKRRLCNFWSKFNALKNRRPTSRHFDEIMAPWVNFQKSSPIFWRLDTGNQGIFLNRCNESITGENWSSFLGAK